MEGGTIDVKYSVLMSVYAREKPDYFASSIESMIKQSLMPNEIIVVKDGPITDELDEVLKSYELKYQELFTIIEIEKNVGLGQALNIGLKAAKNELVARMDTDDISLKSRCELQVTEFIKNPELSIVGSNIDEFYDNPSEIVSSRIVPSTHEEICRFSKKRNPFNHPTVMYRKSAVLREGGYGDFRRNQDFDLFVRMLNKGHKAMNIDKSLLLFRANKDNLQRRKSWQKCSSNISIPYNFWRKGYFGFLDFIIVALGQIIVFISPIWFWEWISNTYLRTKR